MNPVISVIVPAYNVGSYLRHTLDSVLAQTYEHLEVIVVNDGSQDNTGTIIDEYVKKDSRVHGIHQTNGGVTCARLNGVREAHGDWIGFVDGDDDVEPDMYMRLFNNAIECGADISHCGYQMIFPDGHIRYYYGTGEKRRQDNQQGCLSLISGEIEPGLWNKLYRRELLEQLILKNLMPLDIKINEDVLMNYYLFKEANTLIFEDFCPYHYVLRHGSAATSQLNPHKLQDPLRVTHIIAEDCTEALSDRVQIRLIRQLISESTRILGTQKDLIQPYRQGCRKELRQKLKAVLGNKTFPSKLKLMALLAAIWPASYSAVHQLYAKVRGLDKLYNLD